MGQTQHSREANQTGPDTFPHTFASECVAGRRQIRCGPVWGWPIRARWRSPPADPRSAPGAGLAAPRHQAGGGVLRWAWWSWLPGGPGPGPPAPLVKVGGAARPVLYRRDALVPLDVRRVQEEGGVHGGGRGHRRPTAVQAHAGSSRGHLQGLSGPPGQLQGRDRCRPAPLRGWRPGPPWARSRATSTSPERPSATRCWVVLAGRWSAPGAHPRPCLPLPLVEVGVGGWGWFYS